MEVLSDGTVVTCEMDEDEGFSNNFKLIQYDMKGKILFTRKIGENCPVSMVEVKLAGKSCLAMSYQ